MSGVVGTPAQDSLWRLRSWRLAFPASVLSRGGDLFFDFTLVLWIGAGIGADQVWAPAAVGGVLIAAAGCDLVVGPIAGTIVDRVDGQRLIQAANLIQFGAVVSLVLPAAGFAHPPTSALLVWIYAVVVVGNGAGQFYNQARTVMIATTVPSSAHVRAFSAHSGASGVLSIIAPAVAAPLYFSSGPAVAFCLNAATFLASAALHSLFRWQRPVATREPQSFWASLEDGVLAVARNRVLRNLIVLVSITTFGSGMVSVLELFFVTEVLNRPAATLGWMNMLFAAGTLAGLAVAPRLARRVSVSRILTGGIALSGLLIVLYSVNDNFVATVVLYVAIAIPLAMVNVVLAPLAISLVRPDLLGRAMAAVNVLPAVCGLVAMGSAGWLVAGPMAGLDVTMGTVHLGPVNTLFLACGVLFTLAALLTARTLRVAAAHPECGGRLPADESPEDLPSRLAHRSPGSPALADERTTPPARR